MDDKIPAVAACVRPPNGRNSGYFPNVVVVTHESRRALFYDDLLRGKTVAIHFLATRDEGAIALARRLADVQFRVGGRLGRDIFLYTVTTDPVYDTPAVLDAFAAKVQAQPGWLFLTGEPASIEVLKSRFFSGVDMHHHADPSAEDCSLGMLRYGNEAAGIWGSAPIHSSPDWLAQRLAWVMSRPARQTGAFKRRGPLPLRAAIAAGAPK